MHLRRILLLGLVMMIALLTSHGAGAQDIETLVMPGEVIEGHAKLETECSSCHKLFDKKGQKQLCLDCHEDVAADVRQNTGLHGLRTEIESGQCASCHTEHEGRDALIVVLDEDTFDHRFTDFELEGSHAEAVCSDCHARDIKHREAPSGCVDCHREDEPHQNAMGTDCTTCHQPVEWLDAKFDHDTTDYALLGKHIGLACLNCHDDRTFPDPPTACIDCHAEDDAHDGRGGHQCANCHNPSDWQDSSFEHFRDTDFELLGKHGELTCGDCHSEKPFEDAMDMACVSCHLEDDEHDAHNGNRCATCHSSNSWPEIKFDHDTDTGYRLLGAHKETACSDCHVEPVFDLALATTCESCHAAEDPHEGSLGTVCENCHTEVTWQDPVFFDHDLTSFPLLGAHNENECEDCHETQVYTIVDNECAACHSDDDPHRGNFTGSCDSCHNPVAWDLWIFDHDLRTDFELGGAHVRVACNDCHRVALSEMKVISGSCGNCHRADDIHDNEFGNNCGRCHSADSFNEVRTVQ